MLIPRNSPYMGHNNMVSLRGTVWVYCMGVNNIEECMYIVVNHKVVCGFLRWPRGTQMSTHTEKHSKRTSKVFMCIVWTLYKNVTFYASCTVYLATIL